MEQCCNAMFIGSSEAPDLQPPEPPTVEQINRVLYGTQPRLLFQSSSLRPRGRPPNERVGLQQIITVNSGLPTRTLTQARRQFTTPLGANVDEVDFQELLRQNRKSVQVGKLVDDGRRTQKRQATVPRAQSAPSRGQAKRPAAVINQRRVFYAGQLHDSSPRVLTASDHVFYEGAGEMENVKVVYRNPTDRKLTVLQRRSKPLVPPKLMKTELNDEELEAQEFVENYVQRRYQHGNPTFFEEEDEVNATDDRWMTAAEVEHEAPEPDFSEPGPSGYSNEGSSFQLEEEEFVDVEAPFAEFQVAGQPGARLQAKAPRGPSRTIREQQRTAQQLLYGGFISCHPSDIIVPSNIQKIADTVPPPKTGSGRKGNQQSYIPGVVNVLNNGAQSDVPIHVRKDNGHIGRLEEDEEDTESSPIFEEKLVPDNVTPPSVRSIRFITAQTARSLPKVVRHVSKAGSQSTPRVLQTTGRVVKPFKQVIEGTPLPRPVPRIAQKQPAPRPPSVTISTTPPPLEEEKPLMMTSPSGSTRKGKRAADSLGAVPRLRSPLRTAVAASMHCPYTPVRNVSEGRVSYGMSPFQNTKKIQSYSDLQQIHLAKFFPQINAELAKEPVKSLPGAVRRLPATLINGTKIRLIPLHPSDELDLEQVTRVTMKPAILTTAEGRSLIFIKDFLSASAVRSRNHMETTDIVILEEFEDERGAPKGIIVYWDYGNDYEKGPGNVEPSALVSKVMAGDKFSIATVPSREAFSESLCKHYIALVEDNIAPLPRALASKILEQQSELPAKPHQRKQAMEPTEVDDEMAVVEEIIRTGKIPTQEEPPSEESAPPPKKMAKKSPPSESKKVPPTPRVPARKETEEEKPDENLASTSKTTKVLKTKKAEEEEIPDTQSEESGKCKRGRRPKPKRGRPRKTVDPSDPPKVKRPIGRPRKTPMPTEQDAEELKKKEENKHERERRLRMFKFNNVKFKIVNGAIQRANARGKGRPIRQRFNGGLPWLQKTMRSYSKKLKTINSSFVTSVEHVKDGFSLTVDEPKPQKKRRNRRPKPAVPPPRQRMSARLAEKVEQGLPLLPPIAVRRKRRKDEVAECVKFLVDRTVKSLTPKKPPITSTSLFIPSALQAEVEKKAYSYFVKQHLIPSWASVSLKLQLQSKFFKMRVRPTMEKESSSEAPAKKEAKKSAVRAAAEAAESEESALEQLADIAVAHEEALHEKEAEADIAEEAIRSLPDDAEALNEETINVVDLDDEIFIAPEPKKRRLEEIEQVEAEATADEAEPEQIELLDEVTVAENIEETVSSCELTGTSMIELDPADEYIDVITVTEDKLEEIPSPCDFENHPPSREEQQDISLPKKEPKEWDGLFGQVSSLKHCSTQPWTRPTLDSVLKEKNLLYFHDYFALARLPFWLPALWEASISSRSEKIIDAVLDRRSFMPPAEFKYIHETLLFVKELRDVAGRFETAEGVGVHTENLFPVELYELKVVDAAVTAQKAFLSHMINILALRLLSPSRLHRCRRAYESSPRDKVRLRSQFHEILRILSKKNMFLARKKELLKFAKTKLSGRLPQEPLEAGARLVVLVMNAIGGIAFSDDLAALCKTRRTELVTKDVNVAIDFNDFSLAFQQQVVEDGQTDGELASFILNHTNIQTWSTALRSEEGFEQDICRAMQTLKVECDLKTRLCLEQLVRSAALRKSPLDFNFFEMVDLLKSPTMKDQLAEEILAVTNFGRIDYRRTLFKTVLLPQFEATLKRVKRSEQALMNLWTADVAFLAQKGQEADDVPAKCLRMLIDTDELHVYEQGVRPRDEYIYVSRKAECYAKGMQRDAATNPVKIELLADFECLASFYSSMDIAGSRDTVMSFEQELSEKERLVVLMRKALKSSQQRRQWRKKILEECRKFKEVNGFSPCCLFQSQPMDERERGLQHEARAVLETTPHDQLLTLLTEIAENENVFDSFNEDEPREEEKKEDETENEAVLLQSEKVAMMEHSPPEKIQEEAQVNKKRALEEVIELISLRKASEAEAMEWATGSHLAEESAIVRSRGTRKTARSKRPTRPSKRRHKTVKESPPSKENNEVAEGKDKSEEEVPAEVAISIDFEQLQENKETTVTKLTMTIVNEAATLDISAVIESPEVSQAEEPVEQPPFVPPLEKVADETVLREYEEYMAEVCQLDDDVPVEEIEMVAAAGDSGEEQVKVNEDEDDDVILLDDDEPESPQPGPSGISDSRMYVESDEEFDEFDDILVKPLDDLEAGEELSKFEDLFCSSKDEAEERPVEVEETPEVEEAVTFEKEVVDLTVGKLKEESGVKTSADMLKELQARLGEPTMEPLLDLAKRALAVAFLKQHTTECEQLFPDLMETSEGQNQLVTMMISIFNEWNTKTEGLPSAEGIEKNEENGVEAEDEVDTSDQAEEEEFVEEKTAASSLVKPLFSNNFFDKFDLLQIAPRPTNSTEDYFYDDDFDDFEEESIDGFEEEADLNEEKNEKNHEPLEIDVGGPSEEAARPLQVSRAESFNDLGLEEEAESDASEELGPFPLKSAEISPMSAEEEKASQERRAVMIFEEIGKEGAEFELEQLALKEKREAEARRLEQKPPLTHFIVDSAEVVESPLKNVLEEKTDVSTGLLFAFDDEVLEEEPAKKEDPPTFELPRVVCGLEEEADDDDELPMFPTASKKPSLESLGLEEEAEDSDEGARQRVKKTTFRPRVKSKSKRQKRWW